MRRLAVVPVMLLAMALLPQDFLPDDAPNLDFEGCWNAKDPIDGGRLHLHIVEESRSGGRVFSILGADYEPGDWCEGESRMKALAVLSAESHLVTSTVWWCLPDGADVVYFRSDFLHYDASDDTITDSMGAVYHRERFLAR
jgi:hypothetical protein